MRSRFLIVVPKAGVRLGHTMARLALVLLVIAQLGCSGSGASPQLSGAGSQAGATTGAVGAVAVYPSNARVLSGGNQAFRAAVIPPNLIFGEGDPLQNPIWTIQEGSAGGSITPSGVYTAPPAPGTYHVIATNRADSTQRGSTAVRVVQSIQGFASAASMTTDRFGFTATLLLDGRVLVAAGGSPAPAGGTDILGSAETYNPQDGAFQASGSTGTPRIFHAASLLPNGKVLLAGGATPSGTGTTFLSSAEIYDPMSDSFTATGPMTSARQDHTATLLKDGRVLVAGGENGTFLAAAEVYDPSAGQFVPAGNMITARSRHTASLLPDGRVLFAGGHNDSGALATVEFFDPAAMAFQSGGSMSAPRDRLSASLLGNGRVLFAGGGTIDAGVSTRPLDSADIYDPISGHLAAASGFYGVTSHSATLLNSGRVLLAGGDGFFPGCPLGPATLDECLGRLTIAQTYDPATGSIAQVPGMANARSEHKAVLLQDGRVLIVGGSFSNSVEVYQE